MSKGLDCAVQLTHAQIAQIKAVGYGFVGRYYGQNPNKRMTAAEVAAISEAGLSIVSVYEDGPTSKDYFGATRGFDDAGRAFQQATRVGQPLETPIYFAVDYDTEEADLVEISDYFQGIRNRRGSYESSYGIGVYGSGLVCRRLSEAGLVAYTWLAQSRGWAGYDPGAGNNLEQGGETLVCGVDVDLDVSPGGNGGGWKL